MIKNLKDAQIAVGLSNLLAKLSVPSFTYVPNTGLPGGSYYLLSLAHKGFVNSVQLRLFEAERVGLNETSTLER